MKQQTIHVRFRDRFCATENGAGVVKPAGFGRALAPQPHGLRVWAILAGLLLSSPIAWAENRPTINVKDKTCIDYGCHADLQNKAILHSPVAKGLCHPCHVQPQPEVHAFRAADANETLCQSCHTLALMNHVHQPVREGRCLECHDPHQSDFHFLLRADPSRELCLKCHADDPFMSKPHLHGPVAMGACILCHAPHSSWKPKLVVDESNQICAGCHQNRVRRDRESRHVHPPAIGSCDQCHDPHGSDWPNQLLDQPGKLCLGCHEGIKQQVTRSEVVHGAINEKHECGNCHSGHSSSLPTLLKGSLLDTCLGCHDQEIPLPDGRTVVNMAARLKENPNHHGPIRQGDCSACHNPHASPHFDLLTETYPERFYAPYNPDDYRLCFTCHRSELASSQDGQSVTHFRDGPRNLHHVHVSKARRGRTCRACHAVHASKKYAHISESVPYGAWRYPMNFERNPNGGKCSPGCHVERSYDWTKDSLRTETPKDSRLAERLAIMIRSEKLEE